MNKSQSKKGNVQKDDQPIVQNDVRVNRNIEELMKQLENKIMKNVK